ncbi:MAG: peptidoglycan-binding domain-containing protein [Candidatus Paceibacterota bacterium]
MKKYILFLAVLVFVFTFFGRVSSATEVSVPDCSIFRTLRVGSTGSEVTCLQKSLGLFADGKFGPKTKNAVKAWQLKWGLMADGMFGAKSRANWVARGGNSGNFPEGCESASGYSRTTGLKCYAIPSVQSSVIISGVSGPQTLNVNQEGTWTVTAYDKNGGTLSYSVVWGDEASATSSSAGLFKYPELGQTATFTHTYKVAGKYTPKFTVTNNIVCVAYPCPNSSASTSLSVKVGEVITAAPVLSSLSAVSGVTGSQVTIFGDNFTATGNKIKFGDTNTENDPAYNLNANSIVCFKYPCPYNKSITFTVPSSYYVACLHSTPACMIATRMIQPGVYPVSVINANGTSNVMNFTVN